MGEPVPAQDDRRVAARGDLTGDLLFRAARFEGGTKTEDARLNLFHNDRPCTTRWRCRGRPRSSRALPLPLQGHNNPVAFNGDRGLSRPAGRVRERCAAGPEGLPRPARPPSPAHHVRDRARGAPRGLGLVHLPPPWPRGGLDVRPAPRGRDRDRRHRRRRVLWQPRWHEAFDALPRTPRGAASPPVRLLARSRGADARSRR